MLEELHLFLLYNHSRTKCSEVYASKVSEIYLHFTKQIVTEQNLHHQSDNGKEKKRRK